MGSRGEAEYVGSWWMSRGSVWTSEGSWSAVRCSELPSSELESESASAEDALEDEDSGGEDEVFSEDETALSSGTAVRGRTIIWDMMSQEKNCVVSFGTAQLCYSWQKRYG